MAETYSTRISPKDHDAALKVFKSLGLDWSSGIKIYLKQVIKTNGIPFTLKNDLTTDSLSETTKKAIIKAEAEEERLIPDTAKKFSNSKDAIDYLFGHK